MTQQFQPSEIVMAPVPAELDQEHNRTKVFKSCELQLCTVVRKTQPNTYWLMVNPDVEYSIATRRRVARFVLAHASEMKRPPLDTSAKAGEG